MNNSATAEAKKLAPKPVKRARKNAPAIEAVVVNVVDPLLAVASDLE